MRIAVPVLALFVSLFAGLLSVQGAENVVRRKEAKEGFVGLFDGKTLNGWIGDLKGCHVEDGTLVSEHGSQYTEKEYANFVFRFEFKLPPAGNNGIGIRTPPKGDAAYAGMEIQILDDGHPDYKDIKPWQAHGSIYGIVPAKRGFLKPAGEWNREEITADGGQIKVKLNGRVIVEADISKTTTSLDGHDHPGLHNAKGHVAILGHTGPVAFRNTRIKTLP
jgi:hypothetical protein